MMSLFKNFEAYSQSLSGNTSVCINSTQVYTFTGSTNSYTTVTSGNIAVTEVECKLGRLLSDNVFEVENGSFTKDGNTITVTWNNVNAKGKIKAFYVCTSVTANTNGSTSISATYNTKELEVNIAGWPISNISGSQNIDCNASGDFQYSIDEVPGATYSWSATGNIGVRFQGQPSSGNLTKNPTFGFDTFPSGYGSGTISVTTITTCDSQTKTLNVNRTVPASNISGGSTFCLNQSKDFRLNSQGSGPYTWTINGPFSIIFNNGISITVKATGNGGGYLSCQYTEPRTGNRTSVGIPVYTTGCTYRLANAKQKAGGEPDLSLNIFPNPASENITIENLFTESGYRIQLFNSIGQPIREIKGSQSDISIDVKGIADGLYVLHITTSEGIITRQRIVIKK